MFSGIPMNEKQQITTWLRDAHAMEQSLEHVLMRHAAAASDLPEVQQRLEEHLEETKRHRAQVAECLAVLEQTPSALKTAAGGFIGTMQGMSTGVFHDQLVKNALTDYAMEHFEIACYSSIIAAAEEAGLQSIAQICSGILREEVAMADWLEDQIPVLTRMFLHPSAA
ncbi:MAG TPA: ferritin-like domain-containing protein [Opitutaceae bacterium]|nr:ferritin-like domain-containing protein [Opitutaceae bacterium]